MARYQRINGRLLAIALLALVMLAALVIATGGGLSSPGSSPSPVASPVAEVPTAPPGGRVQGSVTVTMQHLGGSAWRFVYTARNIGNVPIAGLQLNAPRSNLFHVHGKSGWSYFGSGVCGGKFPGMLIYWSTGSTSPDVIGPKQTGQFGFTVNTSGVASVGYSLSWGSAHPFFGTTRGPAASSLRASAACGA